ncbi:hypothetical protein [Micromonospora sp. ATCC 39149]|uniref:MYXO-CTERM domain-containing protein n=1 Tax=Micromonospora carbonacea TaxID=47853 RepID=A0A7D6CEV2_9ACTN|nr:hypothetical protein [Micromonospora sp. ATCC 39149]QLJ97648.1 hypothetical protein HZU44_23150 [Micromonospora carbonacea]
MANKMLGKVVAGAALGGASLLVFTPGIAFADGHHDGEAHDGKVYAKPHVVKPGEKVQLLEVCPEPQEHAYVWSKVTGKVELHPADEQGEHGNQGTEEGSQAEKKAGEEKAAEEHGKAKEDETAKPKEGEKAEGGKGGGNADGSYGEGSGYEYDQGAENDYDQNGYDSNGYDSNGYDKNDYDKNGYDSNGHDKNGYDSNGHDKNDYDSNGHDKNGYGNNGYGNNGYDKNGYDKKYEKHRSGEDSGSRAEEGTGYRQEKSWEHKKDFVYYGEAHVAEDAAPGRYELKGSCGEGELVVLPRGHVEGGDGGAAGGTDRGLATTGAGMLGAAALGGIVLMRRRRANGSLA